MRILLASHISNYTPPTGYGGVELIVDTLARELVARGHEVAVFGVKPKDVGTSYSFKEIFKEPVKSPKLKHKLKYSWELLMASKDFDVIHIHVQWLSLPASTLRKLFSKPCLLTLHADPSWWIAKLGIPMVAISKTQQKRLESKGYKVFDVIYNGIEVEKYPFSEEKEDFFVYLGRIDSSKGVHLAIEAAKRSDSKLIIIGPIADHKYFKSYVEKALDNKNIRYLGEVNFETKVKYLSKAKALLYPVQYEEFFGIAMIEALATGTPVIGFARGSVVEIVEDCVVGFVVRNVDEMVQAMKAVDNIDRRQCRKRVEQLFSSKIMAKRYEEIYKNLF